jgi:hypothetical protein
VSFRPFREARDIMLRRPEAEVIVKNGSRIEQFSAR